MGKRISDSTRKEICERYEKLSRIRLVALDFGINERTVRDILKNNSIKTTPREQRNKKYEFDLGFFDNIDTREKAYMLGFVFGDGSVKKGVLSIELSSKDEEILNIFRYMIGSKPPPIKRRVRERNGTVTFSSCLSLCGDRLVSSLEKFGLLGSKSENIKMPKIRFKWDFLRGLSDSDGSIFIDSKNRVYWSLISSNQMCKDVMEFLLKNGIKSRVVNSGYNGLSRTVITKKSDIIQLRDRLYDGDIPYLERKKTVFFDVHYKKRLK